MKHRTIILSACAVLALVVLISVLIGYLRDQYVKIAISGGQGYEYYALELGTPPPSADSGQPQEDFQLRECAV